MLPVSCPTLSADLSRYLQNQRQRAANWNSLQGVNGRRVKAALALAFYSKCGYCEQIEANTVDHFRPQAGDVAARWDWDNFVLACSSCQTYKHNQPPCNNENICMVNPRCDDPLHFLFFDLKTGAVTANPITPAARARGERTVQILGLDRRTVLQDERRRKLWDVLGHMLAVVNATSPIEETEAWDRLSLHLDTSAPFLGVLRQLLLIPNQYTPLINALRVRRPEFDTLVQAWCTPLAP